MSGEQIIGLLLALVVMGVGVVGCLLPGIPGTPLVLLAAVVHKLYFGDASVRWWVLAILVVMTLLAMALDYLAAVVGARKMGASRWGMFGALAGLCLGVIVGFFAGGVGSLAGLLLGPLVGAILVERFSGRPRDEAIRAGVGAALGMVAGAVGKTAISLLMVLIFTIEVLWRS